MCMFAGCECEYKGQKRVLDPLEQLELTMVGAKSFGGTASTPNY